MLLFLFTTISLSAIYHNSIQFLSFFSPLEIKEHANAVYHMFFRLYGGKPSSKKTLGIQQDEALLDVESTPSGNAKRRVHSVNTEMVPLWFYILFHYLIFYFGRVFGYDIATGNNIIVVALLGSQHLSVFESTQFEMTRIVVS